MSNPATPDRHRRSLSIGRGPILLAAALLVAPTVLRAQPGGARFQHISVEQGLSQNYVFAIAQDSKGYMWFGTRDGLDKYDGYGFTHYKHRPFVSGSIPANVIRSICEDRRGILWIGTFRGGLVRFDRATGTFTSYRNDPNNSGSISDDNVTMVYIDRTGTLWAGPWSGGLDRMVPSLHHPAATRNGPHPFSFVRYRHDRSSPTSVVDGTVSAMTEDVRGDVWIGTSSGLCRYDRATDTFERIALGNSGAGEARIVHALVADRSGYLWIGSNDGLMRLDPVSRALMSTGLSGVVDRLAIDSSGVVWASHAEGILTYDPKTGARTSYPFGGTSSNAVHGTAVLSLYTDRAGGVWAGTDGGIHRADFRGARFRNSRHDSSGYFLSLGSGIRGIIEDRSGLLWIGTAGDGVASFDRKSNRIRWYKVPMLLNLNVVNTLYEDRAGTIWVGTRSGLATLPKGGKHVVRYTYPTPVPDTTVFNVWGIAEDRYGHLWVATTGALLEVDRKGGTVRTYQNDLRDSTSISYDGAWKIIEDRSGEIWVGTPGGLNRFDRKSGTFRRYRNDPADPRSLSHNEVWTIFEDSRSRLWIGTWGGGLCRLDRDAGTFESFTERTGLGSNVIHAIVEDTEGKLWISTGSGISRLDPATGAWANFGTADGLPSNEYNPNACCFTRDGDVLFGGLYGITGFKPKDVGPPSAYAPPVVITSFRRLDSVVASELSDGARVEVAYDEQSFSFEFAALDFGAPKRSQYAYRLEGFDRDWVYCGTRRYVTYTNLDPGDYIFRVKATNNDGIWSERGIAIRVTVIPPFWRTLRFQALALVALAAIAVVLYKRRAQSRRELEIALDEAREIERRGIAAELHDGPLQDLYSVRFVLEPLAAIVGNGSAGAQIERIDETLRKVRGSLRSVCGDLQLPSFECGLDVAIDVHAERIRQSFPQLDLELDLMPDEERLSHDLRRNLFRIYRSALNNVIKHAAATRVQVRLAIDSRHVVLEVSDNGRGFQSPKSLNELMRRHHYGLLLIDAHARGIGGRPEIVSEPGKGTTIRVRVERQPGMPESFLARMRSYLHRVNGTENQWEI